MASERYVHTLSWRHLVAQVSAEHRSGKVLKQGIVKSVGR